MSELPPSPVVVATRKSALALAQARAWMADFQRATGVSIEELHVVTTGDRVQDRALSEIGGKGLFIKEIEEAILAKRADLAVHSLKDIPAELAPGLAIGCIPPRADARDVIKTRTGVKFLELPKGARVGTSSLRRVVQLRLARPDLEFLPLRGNVDTRLRKCEAGEVDAVILAHAGLTRLGLEAHITEVLAPELCLPAIGQGALAIEIRQDDEALRQLLQPVHDVQTALLVEAERGVMTAVEGSCQMPVAAFAERIAGQLRLRSLLAEPDGSRLRQREITVAWPVSPEQAREVGLALGRELATS
jgi:hydroxymethylbilane synthase